MRRRNRTVVAWVSAALVGALAWSHVSKTDVKPTPVTVAERGTGTHEGGPLHRPSGKAHGRAPAPLPSAPVPRTAPVSFVDPPAAPTTYLEPQDEPPEGVAAAKPVAGGRTGPHAAPGLDALAPHEQAALRLYASIGVVFEQLDGRCDLIGERVEQLVNEQGTGLRRPVASAGPGSSSVRDSAAAATQLEHFRGQLRHVLGKCPGDPALLGALRKLSLLAAS